MALDEFDPAGLPGAIGELIHRIHCRVEAHAFDMVMGTELTLSQLRVLKFLSSTTDPMPISAIAEKLGMSFATAGRAVDHLVHRGLTHRWEDPADRRSKLVSLTELGREMTEVPRVVAEQQIREFTESLPTELAERLHQALSAALDVTTGDEPLACTAQTPSARADSARIGSAQTGSAQTGSAQTDSARTDSARTDAGQVNSERVEDGESAVPASISH